MIKKMFLVLFFLLSISCYKNPIERNTIVFKDSNKAVEKALWRMQNLMQNLPESTDGFNIRYSFEGNDLYVNNSLIRYNDPIALDYVKVFLNFSPQDKKDFIAISKFLKQNYIDCAYFDGSRNNNLFFIYRELEDEDYHDLRNIIIWNEKDISSLRSHSQILDQKNTIFLIAPIDAIIR